MQHMNSPFPHMPLSYFIASTAQAGQDFVHDRCQ